MMNQNTFTHKGGRMANQITSSAGSWDCTTGVLQAAQTVTNTFPVHLQDGLLRSLATQKVKAKKHNAWLIADGFSWGVRFNRFVKGL
jgi:hypothetical protein